MFNYNKKYSPIKYISTMKLFIQFILVLSIFISVSSCSISTKATAYDPVYFDSEDESSSDALVYSYFEETNVPSQEREVRESSETYYDEEGNAYVTNNYYG